MLKIKFWRIENVVLMKVLEQGDEITRGCGEFFRHGDIVLRSWLKPAMYEDELFVKGNDFAKDEIVTGRYFDTVDEAKQRIKAYVEAVRAYNASLQGESENTADDDIETVIAE